MSAGKTIDGGTFRVEVSDDGMKATLHAPSVAVAQAGAVIAKLKEAEILFDDGEVIEGLAGLKSVKGAVELVVARGTEATDERAGKVEFKVPVSDPEAGLLSKVMVGTLVASVGGASVGAEGKDVWGRPITFAKLGGMTFGKGVELVKGSLMATAAGDLKVDGGVVSVQTLTEVYGDWEAGKGVEKFDGDVVIKGSLGDGRSVQTTGCMVVGGAIEAAVFKVAGWVHVKGGVVGRDKGAGVVGGDLWCRFGLGARLSVVGDVHVGSELTNSRVACRGRLVVGRGPIVGGEVTANGGVTAKTLGAPSGTTTVVEAGVDQGLRATLATTRSEIDTSRKRVAEIREKIAPLMKHLKSLTPQQKEKATELLYDADELEEATAKKLNTLKARCQVTTEHANAEIIATETVWPGVIIRFPGVETRIETAMKGPVRFIPIKKESGLEVVVEEEGGGRFSLPSTALADHLSLFIEKLVTEEKAAA